MNFTRDKTDIAPDLLKLFACLSGATPLLTLQIILFEIRITKISGEWNFKFRYSEDVICGLQEHWINLKVKWICRRRQTLLKKTTAGVA